MNKLSFIDYELDQLKGNDVYNKIKVIESPQGAWLTISGSRVLNLSSNNYLGLANNTYLKKAAKKAIEKFGVGPGAVRAIAGTMSIHRDFEKIISRFKNTEDALSFQSGFNANLGTITSLLSEGDNVFTDELNHASIIDGCRLTKAKRWIYPHNDIKTLEKLLKKESIKANKNLIITDGVFSMNGDIAPLGEIVKIAKKYKAILMVDDAHGEGVLGDHGRGIVDYFKLHGQVDIETGTMSKAFGVVGGYVTGTKKLIEYLRQKARPFLFSSALTPADVGSSIAAIELLESSDMLIKKLWQNTKYFKSGIDSLSFDMGNSKTPIIPILLKDEKLCQNFEKELFKQNIFAHAIVYPTVPKEMARIRVQISASHTKKDLDFAFDIFKKVGKKLKVIK